MTIPVMKPRLTHVKLLQVLEYDRITGIFRWKVRMGGGQPGQIAGSLNPQGYVRLTIDHRGYQAHHLAWFYVYRRWPKHNRLDHKNNVRSANWIDNLRDATNQQNQFNRRPYREDGLKGISLDKSRSGKQWAAVIRINNKKTYLGRFETKEAAAEAYRVKAIELFGEFAWRPQT